jgi:hypothetical membrane protein
MRYKSFIPSGHSARLRLPHHEVVDSFYLLIFASLLVVASSMPLNEGSPPNPSVNGTAVALSPTGGGTYPRLVYLPDGPILGGYTAFFGSTHMTIGRSTDGGQTFSAWGKVLAIWATSILFDFQTAMSLPRTETTIVIALAIIHTIVTCHSSL